MQLDWRTLVGLPPTPSPRDPIERLLAVRVAELTLELRKRELDYLADAIARRF